MLHLHRLAVLQQIPLICFLERKAQKSTPDINPINSKRKKHKGTKTQGTADWVKTANNTIDFLKSGSTLLKIHRYLMCNPKSRPF
jgi:hypothetical protein